MRIRLSMKSYYGKLNQVHTEHLYEYYSRKVGNIQLDYESVSCAKV